MESHAGPGESVGDLRHAAGGTVRQPFAGVRVLVIQSLGGLQVQYKNRKLRPLNDRKHLGGGRVGPYVTDEQIQVGLGELLARGSGGRRAIHQPGGHDGRAGFAESLLDATLITHQPVPQTLKLGPVAGQPNSENAHTAPHSGPARARDRSLMIETYGSHNEAAIIGRGALP